MRSAEDAALIERLTRLLDAAEAVLERIGFSGADAKGVHALVHDYFKENRRE